MSSKNGFVRRARLLWVATLLAFVSLPAAPADAHQIVTVNARADGDIFLLSAESEPPSAGLDRFDILVLDGKLSTGGKPITGQVLDVTGELNGSCEEQTDGMFTLVVDRWYGSWRSWADPAGPSIAMGSYAGEIDAAVPLFGIRSTYEGIVADPDEPESTWCDPSRGTLTQPDDIEWRDFAVTGSWTSDVTYHRNGRVKSAATTFEGRVTFGDSEITFGGEAWAERFKGEIRWHEVVDDD